MNEYKRILLIITAVFAIVCAAFVVDRPHRDSRELIQSIKNEDVSAVGNILKDGVDPNVPSLICGKFWRLFEASPEYPLTAACKTGNIELIRSLINSGANVNSVSKDTWSPLYVTLFYYNPDDIEIVNLLLLNGANPEIEEAGELPAFTAARMPPRAYVGNNGAGYVLSKDYDEDSAKGITEIVMLLATKPVDEMINSGSNETLLMCAAKSGNTYLAEFLISQGCDKSAEDNMGKTAYDYAIDNGYSELAQLLKF